MRCCPSRCCRAAASPVATSVSPPGPAIPATWPALPEECRRGRPLQSVGRRDGVTRRVPLLAEFEGAFYEALSLAVVRTVALRGKQGRVPGGRAGLPAGRGARRRLAPEWLQVRAAAHPGRRHGGRADSLSRQQAQLSVHPARRRGKGPHRAGGAEGQDRARRHDAHGLLRPALDARRQRVSGRRNPRQPHRRHARTARSSRSRCSRRRCWSSLCCWWAA